MSTTHYEININIDGRTMTPAQLFELARGLVEAGKIGQTDEEVAEWFVNEFGASIVEDDREDSEWMAKDMSARPDTWEIEEPLRFQSFAHMPLNDRGQAECITVLAYHLWQLEERLTGGDGSHKSCDPMRIGYAPHSQYTAYSYVFSELDGAMYADLEELESALIRAFTARMANLLANGRKREGVKW